ncbi:nuclear pore complex protein 15 [Ditylenchus destructor]|nr:nuclear pore complex protein 15 [Ditylenchus destructor]
MGELTLFMDPYESEYPSLVREVLSQASRKLNIAATLTPAQHCVLLCGNVVYVWSCANKGREIPHAFRLTLPSTGLKYSINSVCVFSRTSIHSHASLNPSAIVVSPEGCVRYWPEVGKPHKDLQLTLNSDVAFSVYLIEALDHVDRFLVSTTTSNFHIIEIFHSSADQVERVAINFIEMESAAGIGRRMSKMLFGSYSTVKENILKTIFTRGKLRYKEADIVAILPKTLRFFSMASRSLLTETNIAKAFAAAVKNQSLATHTLPPDVTILDAQVYHKGLLMLIAAVNTNTERLDAQTVDIFLGLLRDKIDSFDFLIPIILPDSKANLDSRKLSKCKLFIPHPKECAILLPSSLLLIKNPNSDNADVAFLEKIDDELLGAASVNGSCHVVLRDTGVCVLRRLPKSFDLSFWKKYGPGLVDIPEEDFVDNQLKKAFVVFCSKDLVESQSFVNELLRKSDVNYSELAIDFLKFLVDRQPMNDPRWTPERLSHIDQKAWLREQSPSKNLMLIIDQLEDKLNHYKMFNLFLQHFNLLDKLSRPLESFHNRSGLSVLAEFGEKLFLMLICARWLAEHSTPLIAETMKALSSEFIRRFNHPDNAYLTHFDHVFNEVSTFHEVVPAIVKACQKEMREINNRDVDAHTENLSEVSAFLCVIAEGVAQCQEEDGIVKLPKGASTWLKHAQFLIYFIRHLNMLLDFLAEMQVDLDATLNVPILDRAIHLAKFVLSQQDRWQRDNSRIIAKFRDIGKEDIALGLAEEYMDFTFLIEHCHKNLSDKDCPRQLEEYKQKYNTEDFELFLYEYYREKGMVNYLLAEKGSRLNDYLSAHENINWIKNIEKGEYKKARKTLKAMAYEAKDPTKQLVELSLCKLCVLCEDKLDVDELAELSENIRSLTESQQS